MNDYEDEWLPFIDQVDDEGVPTVTTKDQAEVEMILLKKISNFLQLRVNRHLDYCSRIFFNIPSSCYNYASQEPYLAYWFLLATKTMQVYESECNSKIIDFLRKRISFDGGFASSPQQPSHSILIYVAVCSLAMLESDDALELINREQIYKLFMKLKQPDGTFEALENAESDIRSTFAVIATASMLDLLTDELVEGVAEYVLSCQNYDGGFGPVKGIESHGGFGHCALAILSILGKLDKVNLPRLIQWITARQMTFSGGFNGRTNKLVDLCYTYWVGSMCRIIADHIGIEFWNKHGIVNYVLRFCQDPNGGLLDKPPKNPDYYHTAYGLAGLSLIARDYMKSEYCQELAEISPDHGLTLSSLQFIQSHFRKLKA